MTLIVSFDEIWLRNLQVYTHRNIEVLDLFIALRWHAPYFTQGRASHRDTVMAFLAEAVCKFS